jgi:hypothetical protein
MPLFYLRQSTFEKSWAKPGPTFEKKLSQTWSNLWKKGWAKHNPLFIWDKRLSLISDIVTHFWHCHSFINLWKRLSQTRDRRLNQIWRNKYMVYGTKYMVPLLFILFPRFGSTFFKGWFQRVIKYSPTSMPMTPVTCLINLSLILIPDSRISFDPMKDPMIIVTTRMLPNKKFIFLFL